MFSGGRPITAFSPTTKMGLSIILGRPSIALARALSLLIRDLMLLSLKSFSEVRIKSFGLLPSFFARTRISFLIKDLLNIQLHQSLYCYRLEASRLRGFCLTWGYDTAVLLTFLLLIYIYILIKL